VPCAACAGASPPRECIYPTLPRSQSAGGGISSKRRRLSRDDQPDTRGDTLTPGIPAGQASLDGRPSSSHIPARATQSSSGTSSSSRPPRQQDTGGAEPGQPQASGQSSQPTSRLPTRYPFFRYLGPTAIAPGRPFRRVSVGVTKSRGHKSTRPATATASSSRAGQQQQHAPHFEPPSFPQAYATSAIRTPPVSTSNSANTSRSPSPPYPGLSIPEHLIDLFYEHMSSFLPFIRRSDLSTQIARGTASEILLNIIAALAERWALCSCVIFYKGHH
jgi:hypothetical protein